MNRGISALFHPTAESHSVDGILNEMGSLDDAIGAYHLQRDCADKKSLCHAPASSLYFGRDGYVGACCYSRLQPLGRYPDQSVAEIWASANAVAMRKQLRRNLLPSGCETCAEELQAGNFKGLLASTFDQFALPPGQKTALQVKRFLSTGSTLLPPSRMEFELSNKCNLECVMCNGSFSSSIRANRDGLPPLPMVYDSRFVEQLRPFIPYLKEAKFFGGEPFLVNLYYDIWDLFTELNQSCVISITTNATVFTSKVQQVLERLNVQIIVSLDSLDRGNYESIRKNAAFDAVMNNLESFRVLNEHRGRTTGLAVCPMESNWRELPDLVAFADRHRLSIVFNTLTYPKELSIKYLPSDRQAEIAAYLESRVPAPESPLESHNTRALLDFSKQIRLWIDERETPERLKIRAKCAEYLQKLPRSEAGSNLFRLLAALSAKNADGDVSDGHLPIDDRERVRAFLRGLWAVGRRLETDGLLPGATYEESSLQEFLRLLEANLVESRWRQVDVALRRYPMELLQLAGTRSAVQLFEQTRAYLMV